MNKIKLFLGVALFGAMSFGTFTAYDYVTMSEEERLFLANIEALTQMEPGGGGEHPGCIATICKKECTDDNGKLWGNSSRSECFCIVCKN